jgi:hypothetical protein
MKSSYKCVLPLAAAAVLFASSAVAVPADVAEQWGLLGSWAIDCQQPATNENAHCSFVREGTGARDTA